MKQEIKHLGTVENIKDEHIVVKITQTAACSTCLANKLCNSSESKDKRIDIYSKSSSEFKIGDNVLVIGSLSMGMNAVLFAYIIPLICLIIILHLSVIITNNEVFSALTAIILLSVYYFILFLFRNKIANKFSFTIKHLN